MPDQETLTAATAAPQHPKEFNAATRDALQTFKDENQLSLGDLAVMLDSHKSILSKYLSGKPEGDVERLESLILDTIKTWTLREETRTRLFSNVISTRIARVLGRVRQTNDVGLIHGPAGLGKTCGAELFALANPTAVMVTVNKRKGNASGLESAIFSAVESSNWRKHGTRWDFLVAKFKGSNRLLILDNAHRLTKSAREWLFDFHDETGIPVALLGNPEVLDAIRLNDQQFSRIGLCHGLKLTKEEVKRPVEQLTAQLIPDANGSVQRLAEQVASHEGHFRALKKQCVLARDIRAQDAELSWPEAFRAAQSQLVRDWVMEA